MNATVSGTDLQNLSGFKAQTQAVHELDGGAFVFHGITDENLAQYDPVLAKAWYTEMKDVVKELSGSIRLRKRGAATTEPQPSNKKTSKRGLQAAPAPQPAAQKKEDKLDLPEKLKDMYGLTDRIQRGIEKGKYKLTPDQQKRFWAARRARPPRFYAHLPTGKNFELLVPKTQPVYVSERHKNNEPLARLVENTPKPPEFAPNKGRHNYRQMVLMSAALAVGLGKWEEPTPSAPSAAPRRRWTDLIEKLSFH